MTELALETKTVNGLAYTRLREHIRSGALAAGERLDERALAEALGVSRTPVREAVTRLVSDGLVEHRPYQGNFIRSFTSEEVAGLYDARRVLEVLAVREAVPRMDEGTLGEIEAALDRACAALERNDMDDFADADRTFHRVVARTSGNKTLIAMLDTLEAQVQLVRGAANRVPGLVERTLVEREQILEALRARDSDRAAEWMAEHIDDVKRTAIAQRQHDGSPD